ncbi:hypothetical protein RESH_00387 [Rhodopirellula europaea SH398]|uniref:Uncharacterized protein n=1 Tax=Rhodopirellula europaea SH398 TaxID=1263868 RepID=M5SBN0_9BACT|nr:hypothetical protein RESH_00387 [Rhodopirellula europaea SH398]
MRLRRKTSPDDEPFRGNTGILAYDAEAAGEQLSMPRTRMN